MLEKLCAAAGVSGGEREVRDIILETCKYYEPQVDVMGNVLVSTKGKGKKILLAAHMDEVGLIISDIEDNGFLRFKTVGGIDTGVLIGKKVFVGKKKIPGIIGIKAVHLQKKDDKAPEADELYIDIGADGREEVEKIISLGDYAIFEPVFTHFGDGLLAAKALDDRAGCAILLEMLKRNGNKNLCFAFTAQEEVGCRGSRAAGEYFRPDIAVVIETTICNDADPVKPHETPTRVGKGPVVTFMDGSAVIDRNVMESITEVADMHKIPWQFKKTNLGGTDAGALSKACEGIPTAIVAIPCRNLHSPATVISVEDYNNAVKLIDMWIKDIG